MVTLMLIGMTAAAIAILGYPLFAIPRRWRNRAGRNADDLGERKLMVYRDIKDLEFDLEMGKVSEGDYAVMRADYETEAVGILAVMDRDRNGRTRGDGSGKASGSSCPECGRLLEAQDRFCGVCGRAVLQSGDNMNREVRK